MWRRELRVSRVGREAIGFSPTLISGRDAGAHGIVPVALFAVVALLAGATLVACSQSGQGSGSRGQSAAGSKPSASASQDPQVPTSAHSTPAPQSPVNPQLPPAKVVQPKKVVSAPAVAPVDGGPRIAFKTEEVDFGDVKFGDIVDYGFLFTNVGKEPLKITKVNVEVVEGC